MHSDRDGTLGVLKTHSQNFSTFSVIIASELNQFRTECWTKWRMWWVRLNSISLLMNTMHLKITKSIIARYCLKWDPMALKITSLKWLPEVILALLKNLLLAIAYFHKRHRYARCFSYSVKSQGISDWEWCTAESTFHSELSSYWPHFKWTASWLPTILCSLGLSSMMWMQRK